MNSKYIISANKVKIAVAMISAFLAICMTSEVTIAALSAETPAGEIALTFDDAPRKSTYLSGDQRTEMLLHGLKRANVDRVAFFCTTQGFDENGRQRIHKYADAGHAIANHTHTHPSLNKVGPTSFIQDLMVADGILKSWTNFKPWFRFPFLHEGNTAADRDSARSRLSQLGYINGYVTVDTYDWYMDALLQEAAAKNQTVHFDRLEKAYVEILWDGIQFYDRIARTVLGRSPKHVILLHENDLAALFVDALVEKLRSENWKIISPDEAYTDPIADELPDILRNNQGRVVSIALARGYQGPTTHESESESYIRREFEKREIFESKGR